MRILLKVQREGKPGTAWIEYHTIKEGLDPVVWGNAYLRKMEKGATTGLKMELVGTQIRGQEYKEVKNDNSIPV